MPIYTPQSTDLDRLEQALHLQADALLCNLQGPCGQAEAIPLQQEAIRITKAVLEAARNRDPEHQVDEEIAGIASAFGGPPGLIERDQEE